MRIGNRSVGPGHPVFIVAELSANHAGSLDRAHWLVDLAASAGADAVKLQTFDPESLALRRGGGMAPAPWEKYSRLDLYRRAHTPGAWHAELFAHARERGLSAFSSIFDDRSAAFLAKLGADAIKISAFESGDGDLLRAAHATGLPIIVSVPAGIETWRYELLAGAAPGAALLHCVSEYPASCNQLWLSSGLARLRDFASVVGFSDHSACALSGPIAAALGANIIEAHLMLDIDAYDTVPLDFDHSLSPAEFRRMAQMVHHAERCL